MNEQVSTDEGLRHYMQLHTNNHEKKMLNTTFCDICSKNAYVEDQRKKHIQNDNLFLCHCKINHVKSMTEAKDDNTQKFITQLNIENSIYIDSSEAKWDCQNHEYWNKNEICNQEIKSLNFNNVDFYDDNHKKCNEIIRNGDLSDKTQLTTQDSNHDLYALIIEDDQGQKRMERNYKEIMSNFNILEDQSRLEQKKVCHWYLI